MKLIDFTKALNNYLEKHPETANYEVVTNRYDEIFKKISPRGKLGWFDGHNDFITEKELIDNLDDDDDELPNIDINAICF